MSAAVPDDAVEDGVDRDERDRPDHGPEQPRRTHLSSPAHLAELAHDQRTRRGEARADDDRDDAVLDPSENVVDVRLDTGRRRRTHVADCLLYTSDAADDLLCVDLGGRRIIKK